MEPPTDDWLNVPDFKDFSLNVPHFPDFDSRIPHFESPDHLGLGTEQPPRRPDLGLGIQNPGLM
jgi:hypothetical protein